MKIKEFFKKLWEGIKSVTITIFTGLFCEKSPLGIDKFSLGRLIFIVLFSTAMYMWLSGITVPATLMTILLTFVGYIFGTKAISAIEKLVVKK